MSAWAPVAGGAAGGIFGSAISAGASYAASEKAWRRQRHVLQNQIRWRMADMKAGGLNPILAGQGAFSGGSVSPPMPNIPDLGPNVARGMEAGVKGWKASEEKRLLSSQTNATDATARAQDANARWTREREISEKLAQDRIAVDTLKLGHEASRAAWDAQSARTQAAILAGGPAAKSAVENQIYMDPSNYEALVIKELFGEMGSAAVSAGGGLLRQLLPTKYKSMLRKFVPKVFRPRTPPPIRPRPGRRRPMLEIVP